MMFLDPWQIVVILMIVAFVLGFLVGGEVMTDKPTNGGHTEVKVNPGRTTFTPSAPTS